MEVDEIMYECLKYINRESQSPPAHSDNYIKALEQVGYIKRDWDKTYITEFGKSILDRLRNKFESWH